MSSSPSPARLVLVMCAAEVFGMASVFAFPALLPRFLLEWRLTHTQAGWINGIFYAGYTLCVPLLASLTDRMDARRVYLVSTAVGGSAALGFALFAQGFWTGLFFRALGGLGLAGTYIPGLKVVVDRLDGTAQARAIPIYTATFGIGTSLSFFGAGKLGALWGWRWAFGITAASALLALLLVLVAVRPKGPAPYEGAHTRLLDFRPVLRNRKAMAYVLAYAAHMWELFGMRAWMVAFLAFSLSLQETQESCWSPSVIIAMGAFLGVGTNVAGAELALRWGRRTTVTLLMWASTLFAFGIGFVAALSYSLVAGLSMVYSVLVTADSGAIHTGAILNAEPQRRGATMAIQSLFGFASASVAPLVVGVVLDATGGGQTPGSWGAAFITMGVVVALGPMILILLERKTRPGEGPRGANGGGGK